MTSMFPPPVMNLGEDVIQKINSLPTVIVEEVFPKVIRKVLEPAKRSMADKLPHSEESFDEYGRSNKDKQSEKVKSSFIHHIRDNVTHKTIRDKHGALVIAGVNTRAGQINFDFGDKAKSQGRVHKLWWKDGTHEVYHDPRLRKQTQDIPEQVTREFRGNFDSSFQSELEKVLVRKQS